MDYLSQKPLWPGLQTVAMVQCERRSNGHTSTDTRYFISSLPSHAAPIAQAVRTHWTIENSLHWGGVSAGEASPAEPPLLDVSFHEDDCRIHAGNAAQNMALLRQVTLSLLAQDKSTKRGIAAKRKKAAWDQAYLIKILTQ